MSGVLRFNDARIKFCPKNPLISAIAELGCNLILLIRRFDRWPNDYLLAFLPADEEGLVADLAAALWVDPEPSVEGMDIEIGDCLTQSLIL